MRELLGLAGDKLAWIAIYAVAGILALYWVGLGVTVWRLRRREREKKAYPPVSILVATHRPGEGKRFLEGLRTLRYAAPWEVVMVLDRLPPGARREIDEVGKRVAFPVQLVAVQETAPGWSPKKYALAKGLERVRYEWVVVLDADVEVSQTYLGSLMGEVAEGVDAVVGLGWLRGSGVAAWEAALIQIESVGRAAWGRAYMATGRGWAVRKGYLLTGLYLWRAGALGG
jgi:cellulose synthase/poly-beta-1,6-N-acetylglucosamine synthase-like glycosyltransferase